MRDEGRWRKKDKEKGHEREIEARQWKRNGERVIEEAFGEMRINKLVRAQVLPIKTNLRLKWCWRNIFRILLHPSSSGTFHDSSLPGALLRALLGLHLNVSGISDGLT